jgi:hypothetical protein
MSGSVLQVPKNVLKKSILCTYFFDSLKPNFAELDTSDSETGSDGDQDDWEDSLNDKQLLTAMFEMDNKLQDPYWIPEHLRKKAEIRAKSNIGEPWGTD